MFGARLNAGGWAKRGKWLAVAAAAVAGLGGSVAMAHPHWPRVDVVVPVEVDAGPPCRPPVQVVRQVWVEPTYRLVCDRQWVEPTYRTVVDRVWVPPVTRAGPPQQVWVPDQYGYQDGVAYDRWGRPHRATVRVLVAAGHYDDCGAPAEVVVTPGYYQDVTRQEMACGGHYATVDRQELVTPGHWETRYETLTPPPERPRVELRVRLPF